MMGWGGGAHGPITDSSEKAHALKKCQKREKLFETAEWLKSCVLAYQNGSPLGRKIMVRPLPYIVNVLLTS